MSARFKMSGMTELKRKLASLDRKLQRSITGKVLRAGAKITVRALRSDAPKATGRGAKAIGTKIKTYKGTRIVVAISGERMTSRRGREKTSKAKWGGPHFHLIEYGTGQRHHTGEKAARAAMAGGDASLMTRHGVRFGKPIKDIQDRIKKGQRLNRPGRLVAESIRRGKSTGRVQAKPFFKKAWERVRPQVLTEQARVLGREIEAAARVA